MDDSLSIVKNWYNNPRSYEYMPEAMKNYGFTKEQMLDRAEKAGFVDAVCREGVVCGPDGGMILHCECGKPA